MSTTTSSAASRGQTWAIFCATKVDVRDAGLSYEQASEILDLPKPEARERAIELGGVVKGKLPGDASEHEALFARAWEAGVAAAEAHTPTPMVVYEPSNMMASLTGGDDGGPKAGSPVYAVSGGVCGFAWVNVNPGNSSFARWLVKTGRASSSYSGGVNVRIGAYGQSMERKYAHAVAMANVLREGGIARAYPMSRED